MEILQFLKIADEISTEALPVSESGIYRGSSLVAERYRRKDLPIADSDLPFPALRCSQELVTKALWDAAERDPQIDFRRGSEVVDLSPEGGSVCAVVQSVESGHTEIARSKYAVVAEGVHSRTRERLGIHRKKLGEFEDSVSILFTSDLRGVLRDRLSLTYQITASDFNGTVVAVNNSDRWLLMVSKRELVKFGPGLDAACTAAVRRAIGADHAVVIDEVRQWRPSAWYAERLRSGRVFLVGDAAHSTLPVSGIGMNCGIQDSFNLAWKIAYVLQDVASPDILASYEEERLPIAVRSVAETVRCTVEQRRNISAAVTMDYVYRSRIVVPDEPSDGAEAIRPGRRFPHLWLNHARVSTTINSHGTSFALIADPAGPAASAFRLAASEFGLPLRIVWGDGRFREMLGQVKAALVRPDGHVAWIGLEPSPSAASARRVLGRSLGRWEG
jgi:2-polyprenyl-6-methoxyphenol hydroxylase-like FAD-dependent oxidoreductase